MGRVVSRSACPSCVAEGRDSSNNHLRVYEDNSTYCHRHGYTQNHHEVEVRPVQQPQYQSQKTVEDVTDYPICPGIHKPFSLKTMQRYGVRSSYDQQGGYIDAIYYPYNSRGKPSSFKQRTLPKFFSWVGKGGEPLFGLSTCVGTNFVILTEGEDDALAVSEMTAALRKNPFNAVSLRDGANEEGTLSATDKKGMLKLREFETVIVCLDADDGGDAMVRPIADKLASGCKVKIANIPAPYKDAAEMQQAGAYQDFMDCINSAEDYTPAGVVYGSEISVAELMRPVPTGLLLPYPNLNHKLMGIREGEITLICAGTGIGKTTLMREIGYCLISQHSTPVANIYLEEQMTKTAQGYIAIHNNIPLPVLRANPEIMPVEVWQETWDYLKDKCYHYNHFASVACDTLVEKMRYFKEICGCKFVMLDHISMVVAGLGQASTERKDIDILMTRLAELVTETGLGIIAVVHLNRSGSDGPDFSTGDIPSLKHLRGSSSLECTSFNIIALSRDQKSNKHCDIIASHLLKNREWGRLGICDVMEYHHNTGRLLVSERLTGI